MKALALAFLLCAAPLSGQGLPPLPDSVETLIGPVPIVLSKAPCGNPRELGCYVMAYRIIFVHDSLPLVMAWKVALHEIGHLRLSDARVVIEDEALEQRVVDLWATWALHELLARRATVPAPAALPKPR